MKKIILYILIIIAGVVSVASASSIIQLNGGGIVNLNGGGVMNFQTAQYPGMCMNYGAFQGGYITPFSTTTNDIDLAYLYSKGYRTIRSQPTDPRNSTNARAKQVALASKRAGMYTIHSLQLNSGFLLSDWNDYINIYIPAQTTWAHDNNIDEISLGNEEELGNTAPDAPSDAQIKADIKTAATAIKALYPTLKISYVSAGYDATIDDWYTAGIGDIDYIGFNAYGSTASAVAKGAYIFSRFGTRGWIGEFNAATAGLQGGILNYSNESNWAQDVRGNLLAYVNSGLPRYCFFMYKDGGNEPWIIPDSYAVYASTGLRKIVANVLGLN